MTTAETILLQKGPRVFDSREPSLAVRGALGALHLVAKAAEVDSETDQVRDPALQ